MVELSVNKEMADALWEASRDYNPAVLTVFHEGKLIQFRLGIRSTEIIKHGPTGWRNNKECTVRLELVQMEDASHEAS